MSKNILFASQYRNTRQKLMQKFRKCLKILMESNKNKNGRKRKDNGKVKIEMKSKSNLPKNMW